MKVLTTIIFSLIFSVSFFSQIPEGNPIESVSKQKLREAKLLSDIIPNYPAAEYSKTIDYVSVEILATCEGKPRISIGKSDKLTPEQKSILDNTDTGTSVGIDIKFKYKNAKNTGGNSKVKSMAYMVKVIN